MFCSSHLSHFDHFLWEYICNIVTLYTCTMYKFFCILAMLTHLLPLEHFYIRYFQCFALDIQTYEGWV